MYGRIQKNELLATALTARRCAHSASDNRGRSHASGSLIAHVTKNVAFVRGAAGVEVETRDISLAGRILAAFADLLPADLIGTLVYNPRETVIRFPPAIPDPGQPVPPPQLPQRHHKIKRSLEGSSEASLAKRSK